MTALERCVSAVVLAAGRGVRMGLERNKVFLDLGGRTVLEHSLAVFAGLPEVAESVVVLSPEEAEDLDPRLRTRLEALGVTRLVKGGVRRFDSAAAGVAAADRAFPLVLLHDGARPFPPPAAVRAALQAAAEQGGAVLAVPVEDTLKRVDEKEGRIVETVSRRGLYRVQTPQVFRRELYESALEAARSRGLDPTDDAAVLEAAGIPVAVVPGDPLNLKITVPGDLELARAILRSRREKGGAP